MEGLVEGIAQTRLATADQIDVSEHQLLIDTRCGTAKQPSGRPRDHRSPDERLTTLDTDPAGRRDVHLVAVRGRHAHHVGHRETIAGLVRYGHPVGRHCNEIGSAKRKASEALWKPGIVTNR